MTAYEAAALLRNNKGTPTGEVPVATVSRGVIDTKNRLALVANRDGRLEDRNGALYAQPLKCVTENFNALDTADQVAVILPTGAVASGATGALHHIYTPNGNIFAAFALGAGQTALPAVVADGLDVGGDAADDEGYEIISSFLGATGRPFVVGKDPAFFFRCKFSVADVSGTDALLVGFRRAELHRATYTDIPDYAALGINASANPAAIKCLTGNDGTDTATDTTQTVADGRALTVEVRVSAAGAVTYKHDAATSGILAAPTTVAAFSFDDGDPVIPFFRFLNSSDLAGAVIIHSWEAGYLD